MDFNIQIDKQDDKNSSFEQDINPGEEENEYADDMNGFRSNRFMD